LSGLFLGFEVIEERLIAAHSSSGVSGLSTERRIKANIELGDSSLGVYFFDDGEWIKADVTTLSFELTSELYPDLGDIKWLNAACGEHSS